MSAVPISLGPSSPDGNGAASGPGEEPILEARNLVKHFPARGKGVVARGRVVHAVDDVSLALYPGRVSALVGESGSGKSTLARLLSRLETPTSGNILLRGEAVPTTRGAFRRYVSDVQLILQDSFGSFNPLQTVSRHLERVLRIHEPATTGPAVKVRVDELLQEVNLEPPRQYAEKYPHELSGGQRQRASISRALAAAPSVLLADEPVSSLDVSIRLGILNLLGRLASERRVALLYVTHDIATARYFAETTSVMYAGEIIESGPSEDVTQEAAHPYTQLLISSAPDPDRRPEDPRMQAIGQPPSLIDPPAGCRFHPRCPFASDTCRTERPPRVELRPGHWARCWLYADGSTPAAPPQPAR